MIHRQTPFRHEFFQIPQRNAIPQVPLHTKQDDLILKMTPSERGRSGLPHFGLRYQIGRAGVCDTSEPT
jgi:hypothetical protein